MASLFTWSLLCLVLIQMIVARKPRSAGGYDDSMLNSVEHIWGTTTVAVGDTAVLHCSFDALFQQLRNGNIDWVKEMESETEATAAADADLDNPIVIATGKTLVINDRRYRVYRPHNSALSVLIIRRVRKQDAGVFRCNLAGSTTRHKYMVLNITDSKIEAQTSPAESRVKVDSDVTLWCNATGYPNPVVYWTREDRNRKLPDGSYQYWGNGLQVKAVTEYDTGIYVCYLDNFVQPVVTYKFSVLVEDNPWKLDGYKMRFDSSHWFPASTIDPIPVKGKSFLLMCETRGSPKPPPTISWYRGGEPVTNGKHYYIIDDSSDWRQNFVSSTLVIMKYSPQFEGRYVCVASNGFRLRKQKFHISETYSSPVTVYPNQNANNEGEDEKTAQAPVRGGGAMSNKIEHFVEHYNKGERKQIDMNEAARRATSSSNQRMNPTQESDHSRTRSSEMRSRSRHDGESSRSKTEAGLRTTSKIGSRLKEEIEKTLTTTAVHLSKSDRRNERTEKTKHVNDRPETRNRDDKSRSKSDENRSRSNHDNDRSRSKSGGQELSSRGITGRPKTTIVTSVSPSQTSEARERLLITRIRSEQTTKFPLTSGVLKTTAGSFARIEAASPVGGEDDEDLDGGGSGLNKDN